MLKNISDVTICKVAIVAMLALVGVVVACNYGSFVDPFFGGICTTYMVLFVFVFVPALVIDLDKDEEESLEE